MTTKVTPAGVRINLSGRELVLPALSLRQIRQVTEDGTLGKLATLGRGLPTLEQIDAAVDLMLLALSRSEATKDISKDELLDIIDQGNLKEAFEAVCQGSGLEKVKPGEVSGPKS